MTLEELRELFDKSDLPYGVEKEFKEQLILKIRLDNFANYNIK